MWLRLASSSGRRAERLDARGGPPPPPTRASGRRGGTTRCSPRGPTESEREPASHRCHRAEITAREGGASAHRPPVPAHGRTSESGREDSAARPETGGTDGSLAAVCRHPPTRWRGSNGEMCAHRRLGHHVAASTPNRSRFPRVIMRLGVTKSRGRLAQSAASSSPPRR
jgi:hypothetical protein